MIWLLVGKGILPCSAKTPWKIVKLAKDQNIEVIPDEMYLFGAKINHDCLPDTLAEYFNTKITTITEGCGDKRSQVVQS